MPRRGELRLNPTSMCVEYQGPATGTLSTKRAWDSPVAQIPFMGLFNSERGFSFSTPSDWLAGWQCGSTSRGESIMEDGFDPHSSSNGTIGESAW